MHCIAGQEYDTFVNRKKKENFNCMQLIPRLRIIHPTK